MAFFVVDFDRQISQRIETTQLIKALILYVILIHLLQKAFCKLSVLLVVDLVL
jgi:hypothetical protein